MYYCGELKITCANVIEYIQKLSQQLEDSQAKCKQLEEMVKELEYSLYNATHDPNPDDA